MGGEDSDEQLKALRKLDTFGGFDAKPCSNRTNGSKKIHLSVGIHRDQSA